MLSEPPGADPHAGWCGRGQGEPGPYPIPWEPGAATLPATRPPNNAAQAAAEVVEGRGLREGNAAGKPRPGPRAGASGPSALDRVRRIAVKDKGARFTALLHHVDVDRLREAYRALNPRAATGVDGVTWLEYGVDLVEGGSEFP
jgi:hypothetical protein